ncbi:MAG: hypothetical protein AAF989_03615, partial [Planctomycetota bacterium]
FQRQNAGQAKLFLAGFAIVCLARPVAADQPYMVHTQDPLKSGQRFETGGETNSQAGPSVPARQPWMAGSTPIAKTPQRPAGVERPVETSFVPDRSFSLPVEVSNTGKPPAEVHLFVAEQETAVGKPLQWQMYDRQPFPLKAFEVTSNRDGHFFFAMRTLDENGEITSARELRPVLKVVVDTTVPKIELDASADESGQVHVSLDVNDSSPIQQMLVQYITESASQWEPVVINEPFTGSFAFTPRPDWRLMTLRVEAIDSVGMKTIRNERIERPRLAALPSTRFAATESPQVPVQPASTPITQRMYAVPRDTSTGFSGVAPMPAPHSIAQTTPPHTGVGPVGQTLSAVGSPNTPSLAPTVIPPGMNPRPADPRQVTAPSQTLPPPATPAEISANRTLNAPQMNSLFTDGSAPMTSPNAAGSANTPNAASSWTSTGDAATTSKWDPARVMTGPRRVEDAVRPLTPRPERAPRSATSAPSAGGAFESAEDSNGSNRASIERESQGAGLCDQAPPTGPGPSADPGFDPRSAKAPLQYSHSPRFSLEYELEAVGSNGVDAVELWGSVDEGENWKKWGEDPDGISPFDIETNGEGVFAFRIVVVGANGLTSPTPRHGESPDIMVVVDETPPKTRLSGASYGKGDTSGCLIIEYQCQDDFLSPRPITLAFSPTADGPWTTIAGGLRNDGQYIWPADPGLPASIFLRVSASDRAGNVGNYQLSGPIDTQGLAPRARIRGFQTLGRTARPGPSGAQRSNEQTANLPSAAFK